MVSTILTLLLSYAVASEPVEFAEVNDLLAPATAPVDEAVRYEQLAARAARIAQEAAEAEEAQPYQQWYESGVTAYYAPANDVLSADYGVSVGLNTFTGVNYHDGRTETYYSSNVLYHYRTWTLDDEGFWRDSDGYYVVAASDIEHGETFTGSKGECKVYDCGCNEGVTDYYVNW